MKTSAGAGFIIILLAFVVGVSSIQAQPINIPPIIANPDPAVVIMSEDGSPTSFALSLNASDENRDTLTWSIQTPATNGAASVAAPAPGNIAQVGYTPKSNFHGADSFVVQVSDGNGGSDTITVNVTVQPINDPPVITEGVSTTVTISENGNPTPFALTLHATDMDNDTLTWKIRTPPVAGTASVSATPTGASQAIGYTPSTGFIGDDTFVVEVNDGNGASDPFVVGVMVQAGPNNAPVITQGGSVAVTMSENGDPTPFSLTLNATDADNDLLTWSIQTPATNGVAAVSATPTGMSQAISYTPNVDFNGSDNFVVRVSDGNGGSDAVTVNVTVQPVVSFQCVAPLQVIQVSGQNQVAVDSNGNGQPDAADGFMTACFDPVNNCFIIPGGQGLKAGMTLTAASSPGGLFVNSIAACGSQTNATGKDFDVALDSSATSPTGKAGSQSFQHASITISGQSTQSSSGQLVDVDGNGQFDSVQAKLSTGASVLLDIPLYPNATNPTHLRLPNVGLKFGNAAVSQRVSVFIPMTPQKTITVTNATTGQTLGVVDLINGATLGGAPAAIPTLSEVALALLLLAVLFTATVAMRRRV